MSNYNMQTSDNDFNNARIKAVRRSITSILNPEKKQMLSFYDIKPLIKPKAEFYKGVQSIPIDKIVGSEGRYNDFDRAFLPKREHLRNRWRSVNIAALEDIYLPPIKVFKVGEVYFVRDGNHRVSVAKQREQIEIDAEITEITSEIKLSPDITITELKKMAIAFELNRIRERSGLEDWIDFEKIKFTAPGRYEEMLRHILGHQEYLTLKNHKEVKITEAANSWFITIYLPVVDIILSENLLDRFPERTEADLYIWVIKHWPELDNRHGDYPKIRPDGKQPKKFILSRMASYLKLFFKKIISR
ncbi:MAG: transcriptional regulator [Spirochaetales bacterium]|nr:transcriptional regulator [Spirochaetales bacterium]